MSDGHATLHGLLEASARAHPDNVAMIDPGVATATYGELDAAAEGVRQALAAVAVGAGDRIGIYAPKSIGAVAAVFGILKSGGAYVPADATAPAARGAFILGDCSVKAIIAERSLLDGLRTELPEAGLQELDPLPALEDLGADLALISGPAMWEGADPSPPGLAYILYTSGSTGEPKGVMLSHQNALAFVDWCSDELAPRADDRFSSHAPLHFDLSVLDLYVATKHAASVVLIGEKHRRQPLTVARLIAEQRLTVWYSTPSALRLLVEYGGMEPEAYPALRLVLFAGEVFPLEPLRALQSAWPGARYYNLYGPTETNVCTFCEVPVPIPDDRAEPYPIGRVCAGARARVLGARDREVDPGSEGELVIAGSSVMIGYWNRRDEAEPFLVDEDGTRWYRTGDVVRETSPGVYEFVGRRDRMVKRRGYRVELGEIETILDRHPSVDRVAVVARHDPDTGVRIRAFLEWKGSEPPSTVALKQFCASNLPLYMIPDRFSVLETIPRTTTDKIDYQKLKELD